MGVYVDSYGAWNFEADADFDYLSVGNEFEDDELEFSIGDGEGDGQTIHLSPAAVQDLVQHLLDALNERNGTNLMMYEP